MSTTNRIIWVRGQGCEEVRVGNVGSEVKILSDTPLTVNDEEVALKKDLPSEQGEVSALTSAGSSKYISYNGSIRLGLQRLSNGNSRLQFVTLTADKPTISYHVQVNGEVHLYEERVSPDNTTINITDIANNPGEIITVNFHLHECGGVVYDAWYVVTFWVTEGGKYTRIHSKKLN